MPAKNCCAACSRMSACLGKPRSMYFCSKGSLEDSWFCMTRCQPLRCFRGGPKPEYKGQTKLFEEEKP